MLQVAATPQLTPSTTGPDLVVILVVSLALLRGVEWAAAAGFVGGLMLDSLDAQSLGLSSLLYVLVAMLGLRAGAQGRGGGGRAARRPVAGAATS